MVTGTDTAEPIGRIRRIPLYANGTAPGHLLTKTGLEAKRLRPAPGQPPAAYIRIRYYKTLAGLYDPAAAIPLPPRRIGDAWAYRDSHTCPRCGEIKGYVVNGEHCGDCRKRDHAKQAAVYHRTCRQCRAVKPWRLKHLLCGPCLRTQRAEKAAERARRVERAQWCAGRERYGCTVQHASKAAVVRHLRAGNSYFPVRYCDACEQRRQAEVEQARAAERAREETQERARREQVAALEQWARDVLADPNTVVLDTETTGLDDGARIVEISITTAAGDVLLDTLVNPGEPIPVEATDIHGITAEMVAGAPTFADLVPQLEKILHGKRTVIYNADYDVARIQHEIEIHLDGAHPAQRVFDQAELRPAAAWIARFDFEDAMVPYSDWYGEVSDWYGGYRWQRRNGGHRALGDCLAVIDCLKAMARPSVYEEDESSAVEGA